MSLADACAAVARLTGRIAGEARSVRGGGNNEVFCVETESGPVALKRYPADDPRDRLGHEFDGLVFLQSAGERAVARPLAVDRRAGLAVYEWIAGVPATPGGPALAAMLAFAGRLHAARRLPGAEVLPAATEAVVTMTDLTSQIDARIERLHSAAHGDDVLAAWLSERAAPLRASLEPALPGGTAGPLTLSPSDFGTHNMLVRPQGNHAFLDFEYFGWDDPVKLMCDVVLHPAMELTPELAREFLAGSADIYGDDPHLAARLRARFPLFALRWALIVLNEFVPEIWERRQRAGATAPWAEVKARQLAKADALIARATLGLEIVWTS